MPTIYPERLDTDLEIRRIDDDITEMGGDVINSLRDAIFAIEGAVGIDPQGSKASLVDRINVSIDDNGNIKRTALEDLGLLTLPIVNRHVAFNAAIEESKLDLDFDTITLKNLIDSLRVDMTAAQSSIAGGASSFSLHVLGQDYFHDGYQIKIDIENGNGVAGLVAETVGDAINEFSTILLVGDGIRPPHIDFTLPILVKHVASDVSVDTTNFDSIDRAVTTVQQAFDSIDAAQGILGITHVDNFHANGILKDINSGTLFNENRLLLGPVSGISYTEGTSVVKIPGVTSFATLRITVGSIIEIPEGVQDAGSYQVRAVGPLQDGSTLGGLPTLDVDELSLFHVFIETALEADGVVANIYEPTSISSEGAPLVCVVRNNQTIVDTISILPPDAARVVSVGFNGSILNSDGYEIAVRVGIGQNNFRELTIPDLNLERLGTNQAQPVDAKSVAERINAYVSDPTLGFNFPITAYKIGNELAIAHNLVGEQYTIEILDGYTGNFALGLDAYGSDVVGRAIAGNINNIYSVNGVSLSSLRTVFDGYAEISSDMISETDTFSLWTNEGQMINPLLLGIAQGSVIHITEHPTVETNGSYTLFGANSTTVSLFGVQPIDLPENPTRFNVLISDSNVSLAVLESVETDNGIVEFYVDSDGKVLVHERLSYGTNLGSTVEIIDVSNNFPVGNFTLNVGTTATEALFTIIDDSLPGETVTVQSVFKGVFKLYHPNNIDYVLIKITAGTIISGIELLSIQSPLNYDESFQICTLHFNGTLSITNTIDKRFFGNLSANQVRDDFIELFSQQPVSDLRSDGVARGFDIMDIPFLDSITQMQALPLRGGVAYVNGVRLTVETQKVIIPSFDEDGNLLDDATRIVGINEFGSIRVFSDELGELLSDGYNASIEFGKILPLYQVSINDGTIDAVTDVRLFINNLDNKLELIVDETNNVVGNFRSLEGALLYASSYPHKEHLTIKIINAVYPNGQVIVPNGISIVGGTPWGGENRHQIINTLELGESFLVLSGNNRLENIEVISELATTNGALIEVVGRNVSIEKCLLQFAQDVSSIDADVGILVSVNADQDVKIINNKIDMVYSGIVGLDGCNRIMVRENIMTNLAGTGGVSNGIKMGTVSRAVANITISDNIINVPSVVTPADIRGISIDIGEAIEELRIVNNSIIHSASDTMTNGIRIENELATGNKVAKAFITDNSIEGIALDDNDVWGIYISSIEDGKISQNIISDVGVSAGNTDVGCIGVGDDVDFADITGNILKNCDVTRGIEVTSGAQVNIAGNTLDTLGADAFYISGNATHSSVSNNILVGPGDYGIRWTGTNSKISDNNLSQPGDATEYAFSSYAIYVLTSDVDVMNNTITGMVYDDNAVTKPVGITNATVGRDRIKIIGNTISGSLMYRPIELFGEGHSVSNNRLFNSAIIDSNDTDFIVLNGVTNSLVMGNTVQGDGRYAFANLDSTDSATTISNVTISNNIIDPSPGAVGQIVGSFNLNSSSVSNCFISGNRLPVNAASVTGDDLIGSTTALDYSDNTNTIGINAGLLDSRTLPAASGMSASSSDSAHWVMSDTFDYWQVNNTVTATRNLFFPIDTLPNGAQLVAAQVHGSHGGAGVLTMQLFKKSRSSGLASATSISSSETVTAGGGEFGYKTDTQTGPNGYIAATTPEVINHYDFHYYVKITNTGSSSSIQINSATIIFRY